MKLSELSPAEGSVRAPYRKGRGAGSGNGKTGLEIVNLSTLDQFQDGDTVTVHALLEKGILSKCRYGYKVLGSGKLSKKLTVQASAFSASAKEAIEAAGGKAEVI